MVPAPGADCAMRAPTRSPLFNPSVTTQPAFTAPTTAVCCTKLATFRAVIIPTASPSPWAASRAANHTAGSTSATKSLPCTSSQATLSASTKPGRFRDQLTMRCGAAKRATSQGRSHVTWGAPFMRDKTGLAALGGTGA